VIASPSPLLIASAISKSFGPLQALSDVSLVAYPGEILALVGDNGAGKSTLVKVLSGIHRPDKGTLVVAQREVTFRDPGAAREAGIATVFQDLALVECLDVAANVFLGREPRRGPFVQRKRMVREAGERLASLKIRVPSVRTTVGLLSGGQRQGVAIARAVLQGGRIIIMDEPTAALGVRETRQVEGIIGELRDQGHAVIVVSHDLELVFRLADRIQVMRLGRRAGVLTTSRTDRHEVVSLITGSLAMSV